MAKVHVYKKSDKRKHNTDGKGCWCEPFVRNEGFDSEGEPARIFVHSSDAERKRKSLSAPKELGS